MGTLYAALGLIIGGIISLIAVVAGSFADHSSFPFLGGMAMGAGAIVIFPILYGVMGAIISAISAALYNVVAGMVGGLQIEVETTP
jgi:hypothetical protein